MNGCRKCADGNPNICLQCIDTKSYIVEGKCKCPQPTENSDEFGICAENNGEIDRINFFDVVKSTLPELDWSKIGVATPAKDKTNRQDQYIDWAFSLAGYV